MAYLNDKIQASMNEPDVVERLEKAGYILRLEVSDMDRKTKSRSAKLIVIK